MDRVKWQKTIIKQMKDVGTYGVAYKSVIEALSTILEKRDAAMQEIVETDAPFVVVTQGREKSETCKKNPLYQTWQDLNTQALAYWRDLGLTPAGLKKIKDMVATSKMEVSGLEKALSGLAGELGKGS